VPKWNRETIAAEILHRHQAGMDLSYSGMTRENLPLLRAATRYMGSWQAAVEYAGLNYEDVRRYKSWTNDRIVERIRELYAQGADLSWRHVSLTLDPSVAAAATKKSHFGSWRAALEAAGLDYDAIRRYHDWSEDEVLRRVRDLYAQGQPLNAKRMEKEQITLITAARRRFPSWDRTLAAAGLDYRNIVLRAPFRRRRKSVASVFSNRPETSPPAEAASKRTPGRSKRK
jgi:enamine deaminase RidA (YjgF/YER057c/UK114 family)